jgi:hypothetical protein
MRSAFVAAKAALTGCVLLIHPTPGAWVAFHVMLQRNMSPGGTLAAPGLILEKTSHSSG